MQTTPLSVTISIGKIYAILAKETRSSKTQFLKPANTRVPQKFRRNFELRAKPRRNPLNYCLIAKELLFSNSVKSLTTRGAIPLNTSSFASLLSSYFVNGT
jgi:hypothetical protein